MMQRIDHIGVVVDDLAEVRHLLGEVFGLQVSRELDLPDLAFRAVFYRCGDVDIEVIEMKTPEGRRQRLGEGVQARLEHIAIQVDSTQQTLDALGAIGIRALKPAALGFRTDSPDVISVGNTKNVWMDPATCSGVMYQFVEKS
jgi:methylmalonyl-CoA/ethylmalonyl-CoA epimerase